MSKAVGGSIYGMEEVTQSSLTSDKSGKTGTAPKTKTTVTTKTMIGFTFTGSINPDNWNKLETDLQEFFTTKGYGNITVEKVKSRPTKP
jgi:hypothetical protein